MNKREFLVVYDYGMGAIWLHLLAESKEQIQQRLPRLTVIEVAPPWMGQTELAALPVVDVDDPQDKFLTALRRGGS